MSRSLFFLFVGSFLAFPIFGIPSYAKKSSHFRGHHRYEKYGGKGVSVHTYANNVVTNYGGDNHQMNGPSSGGFQQNNSVSYVGKDVFMWNPGG